MHEFVLQVNEEGMGVRRRSGDMRQNKEGKNKNRGRKDKQRKTIRRGGRLRNKRIQEKNQIRAVINN